MQNKTKLNLSLRANPINNYICISLPIELNLSESVNVVLLYTCTIPNAHNPKPIY